jgi:hypothetical protein
MAKTSAGLAHVDKRSCSAETSPGDELDLSTDLMSDDQCDLSKDTAPGNQFPCPEFDFSAQIVIDDVLNGETSKPRLKKGAQIDVNSGGMENIELFGQQFLNEIQEGPEYVCTCCKRLMFKHSVVQVPGHRYTKNCKTPGDKKKRKAHVDNCLTHKLSYDGHEWICKTCHKCMNLGHIPSQAEVNSLSFDDEPKELQNLCQLEVRLISQRLPFMQIYSLPRGGQKGIHGAVTNVPANINTTVESLPRLGPQCGFVPVKLKKRLNYSGHSLYQSIRPLSVMEGLRWLCDHNPLYLLTCLNENWEENGIIDDPDMLELVEEENKIESMEINCDEYSEKEIEQEQDLVEKNDKEMGETNEEREANRLRGLPYNTCLQPDYALLESENSILCLAPGQDQKPKSLFTDKQSEVLSFPKIFPMGRYGLDEKRTVKLSVKRYFNQRLLNADARCATDTEYLFFAQYYTEAMEIINCIQIAMKKGKVQRGRKHEINAGALNDPKAVQNMLAQNDGFRFLQQIRGSFPYWQRTLWDLFAMVRQLGVPTWFFTLSAADLSPRWCQTIQCIAKQYGQSYTDEEVGEMSWDQKCEWIRRNPVTAARHFDYRLQKFWSSFLKSAANPLGKIVDFFYRIEFQQRGSPHMHSIIWVEGAPKLDIDTDQQIAEFVDRYISCEIPSELTEMELHTLVGTLQKHSHSKSCWKKKKNDCRYHFPKAPSPRTMVSRKYEGPEDMSPAQEKQKMQVYKDVLCKVHEELAINNERTLGELLAAAKVPLQLYDEALKYSSVQPTIVLKRQPKESSINNYNRNVLRYWQANLDLQYIIDAFACAMYILSYISKGERQMGDLLKQAAAEVSQTDDIRKQMRKLGNVFVTHREVSSQEAVYRALSLPLKRSSRQVIFVNSNLSEDRIRILKPPQKLKELPPESNDVFQSNIIDRYCARPDDLEEMCLADFSTNYATSSGPDPSGEEGISDVEDETKEKQGKSEQITLKQNMGKMRKRRRPCVIRCPRFSQHKQPEKFAHSNLMLYYPWRVEEVDFWVAMIHIVPTC